ncbi:MAG TPA: single-stranded DNA-binding protein [Bacteroidetes bacterium]|nr:single-stranded DNA-binding protein [Bacteroidota bacterium]
MTVNKVILVGNVGKDPEVNYIREDVPVAKFPLATSETYTKDGEKITQTEWHNIVLWRKLAKVVENYVRKGSLLYIEGKINTRSYEKDGETKYITEIVADSMRMLGKRSDDSGQSSSRPAEQNEQAPESDATGIPQENKQAPESDATGISQENDDLPF